MPDPTNELVTQDADPSFLEAVKKWLEDLADWIQENLGDPAIASALRDDLGLKPGEDITKAKLTEISQFSKDGFDPETKAFVEAVDEILSIVQIITQIAEQVSTDQMSGWDIAYLWGKLAVTETTRQRAPLVYAIGKMALFISSDPEELTVFDPAVIANIARGDDAALGGGEAFLQRLNSLSLVTSVLEGLLGPNLLESYHGWDPAPDSLTPNSDQISTRANTFVMRTHTDVAGQLAMTLIGVPPEHGGPALLASFGGGIETTQTVGSADYTLGAGIGSGLSFFIPFSTAAQGFGVIGEPDSYVNLSVTQNGATPEEPALRIGDAGKTRLDIAALGFGVGLNPQAAGFRGFIKGGALVISLGEGDGFLQSLSSGNLTLGFDMGITVDTLGGVRIDGGTLLRSTLPVNKTLGGFLDLHYVDVALEPAGAGEDFDAALQMTTAFGVNLGPFQASVASVGFQFKVAFREGNLGLLNAEIGFKPPSGMGLLLDAGIVKGGGSLFFDPARGEYAGSLELKFARWGLKAIGILTTKMPDGSPGFALLLLIYADLPRFHIAYGIFFEGVGGLIGLQHGADIDALQVGIPSGVFDDVLFPANPVADAPRIINRLRVVFPIRAHAFLIGPMFRLTWGTPAVGEIKLGLLLAMDNVLGGDEPISLNSILLLGQIRIGLPETQRGDVVRIICDFFGYLDFANRRFGFYARLRDSRLVGGLELTGSLVLQIDFGDRPSFVVAAGGFHPRFQDLPAGLPQKLDRIGLRFNIGIVKIAINCYLAITSATVQFGADARIKIKLGPVSVDGRLGFDALIYYEPFFRFELDFRAGVTVKFRGHTLMAVDVSGVLSGPGLWRIQGNFKFKVLWWDVEKRFDERWGDRPLLEVVATNLARLLQAAYSNLDNWSAALPAGNDTLVTLSAQKGETEILAHPLGQLRVSQKVAPLNVKLEKYGETPIEGADRFDFQQVTVGDRSIVDFTPTREYLARSNYLRLSEEDRLSKPSFESFDVGVAVGATDYVVPESAVTDGDLSYETKVLEPEMRYDFMGALFVADVTAKAIDMTLLRDQARLGAAASAKLRLRNRLRSKAINKVVLTDPPLAAVGIEKLERTGLLSVAAERNVTLAKQQLAEISSKATVQLVEKYELM